MGSRYRPDRSPRRCASNKVGYSKADAERMAIDMQLGIAAIEADPRIHLLSAYKCRSCPRWHVGHRRED